MADQQRVVDWLDDFLSWLREPLTAMPIDRVMARLRVAYRVNVASWSEQRGDLLTQMVFDPPDVLRHYAGVAADFMAGKYRDCHPLSVWYKKTSSAAPQTAGRVLDGLVPRTRRTILVTPLIKLGLEQQMTIGPPSSDNEHAEQKCAARRLRWILVRPAREMPGQRGSCEKSVP